MPHTGARHAHRVGEYNMQQSSRKLHVRSDHRLSVSSRDDDGVLADSFEPQPGIHMHALTHELPYPLTLACLATYVPE